MGIERFFTKTFTIKRATWSGESSANVTTTTFLGHIQQLTTEMAQNLGLSFTRSFRVWCPVDTAIQEGDQITYGSRTYSIKGINTREYDDGSGNQHLEIMIEEDVNT